MSDSVRPHRRQPTRLPHPWDSPGKNTEILLNTLSLYLTFHLIFYILITLGTNIINLHFINLFIVRIRIFLCFCVVWPPSSVQLLNEVQLFATPWTATCQVSLFITNSWSLLRLTSIELVMPSISSSVIPFSLRSRSFCITCFQNHILTLSQTFLKLSQLEF